jgi:hypothetical protein
VALRMTPPTAGNPFSCNSINEIHHGTVS